MKSPFCRLLFLLCFVSLLSLFPCFSLCGQSGGSGQLPAGLSRPAQLPVFGTRERFLNNQVPLLVNRFHYSPKKFDASLSREWFAAYFKRLDPQRIFFLESDLDDFRSYENILCRQTNPLARLEFVKKVYLRLLHRVHAYSTYSIQCLSLPVDFSVKESVTFDRKDAAWCKTEDELREQWRLRAKNSLLIERLAAEEDARKRREHKGEEAESAFKRPPVKERLAKAYAQAYEYRLDATSVEIMEGFLSSLSQLYDPHTVYWAPESKDDFDIQMRLSLQGIGATLTTKDSYCEIVSLVPGGPADREGTLKEGDRIVEVQQDGGEPVNVVDMPLNKIVKQIRGKKGTVVHLTIMDSVDGTTKRITIRRDEVKLKDAEAASEVREITLSDGQKARVLVICLPSFYADFAGMQRGTKDFKSSSRDVRKLLEKETQSGGIAGVVLDFRGNGGGSLVDAIALAGLFFKSGPVVLTRDANGRVQTLNDRDEGCVYDGPLFVMVDKNSASASEIVAAALQDRGRALIIGTSTTHGKGSVQSPVDLDMVFSKLRRQISADGRLGTLKLTMAKFYRINGASTQLRGVKSDIVFPSYQDCLEMGEAKLPHPLAWDEITSATFERFPGFGGILPALQKEATRHSSGSPAFREYVQDIKDFEKLQAQKEIPLEYAARKAYRDRSEVVTKKIRRLTTLSKKMRRRELTKKALTKDEIEEEKNARDVLMEETLHLMGTYLDILKQMVVK